MRSRRTVKMVAAVRPALVAAGLPVMVPGGRVTEFAVSIGAAVRDGEV